MDYTSIQSYAVAFYCDALCSEAVVVETKVVVRVAAQRGQASYIYEMSNLDISQVGKRWVEEGHVYINGILRYGVVASITRFQLILASTG